MPLTLHHGLAGHQKQQALLALLRKLKNNNTPFITLVPDQTAVNLHMQFILNTQPLNGIQVILGESVMTWDGFLLQLIKRNLPRVHKASSELCRYLIYVLLNTEFNELLTIHPDTLRLATDLVTLAVELKSCGINHQKASQVLQKHLPHPRVLDLLKRYQQELQSRHYFDRGDLGQIVLEKLRQNSLSISANEQPLTLVLSQLYPLRPGDREILRQIKQQHPHITTHVFYDEDYAQPQKNLELAFLDLGDIADESIPYTEQHQKQTLLNYKTPFHEARAVATTIQKIIQQGYKPHDITIVVPNSTYALHLWQSCRALEIAATSCAYDVQLSAFISPSENSLETAPRPYSVKNLIEQYPRYKNLYTASRLAQRSLIDDALSTFEFNDTILRPLSSELANENKVRFIFSELTNLHTNPNHTAGQVNIVPFSSAGTSHQSAFVFFVGLARENISLSSTPTLFDESLEKNSELGELLRQTSYRHHTLTHNLISSIRLANGAYLSASELDFDGKPLTTWHLPDTTVMAVNLAQAAAENLICATDFFKTKKKNFSVSELQDFIDCPYKYYARHHLHLGSQDYDDFDPSGDLKGSFVHQVLFRLIKENESDYLDSLEYETYRKKIYARLTQIVTEELAKDDNIKKFNPQTVDFFAYRTCKTIVEFINKEAEYFQTKKKFTTPKNYEWAFEIPIGDTTISVKGRIDRVDVSNTYKSFTVIDYKTGILPSFNDIKSGNALQLPLYFMAVQKNLYPNYRPSAGLYYGLRDNEVKGFTIADTADGTLLTKRNTMSEQTWSELQKLIQDRIGAAVTAIHQGEFVPKPRHDDLCSSCDYRRICGYKKS